MRLGELTLEKQDCPKFNRAKFEKAVQEIRTLTVLPPKDFLRGLQQLCFQAGVLWVLPEFDVERETEKQARKDLISIKADY